MGLGLRCPDVSPRETFAVCMRMAMVAGMRAGAGSADSYAAERVRRAVGLERTGRDAVAREYRLERIGAVQVATDIRDEADRLERGE
jgi:hypothetical protein